MAPQPEFKDVFVPLVLGCVSLIAWVSLRSDSLSRRIRDAGQELLKADLPPWRRSSLENQIKLFKPRYSSNNKALLWLINAVTAFFLMLVLSAMSTFDPTALVSLITNLNDAFRPLAMILMIVGLLILLVAVRYVLGEIGESEHTLFEDCDRITKETRRTVPPNT